MERKLLSLPSFFVLLLIAGIAFLAAPVVDVQAAAPGAPTVEVIDPDGDGDADAPTSPADALTTAGMTDVVVIKMTIPVKVTGAGDPVATEATGFGKEDLLVTVTNTVPNPDTTGPLAASKIRVTALTTEDDVPAGITGASVPADDQWFVVGVDVPENQTGLIRVQVLAAHPEIGSAFQDAASVDPYAGTTNLPATTGTPPVTASDVHYNTYNPVPTIAIKPLMSIDDAAGDDARESAGKAAFPVRFTINDPAGGQDRGFEDTPTFTAESIDLTGGMVEDVGAVTAITATDDNPAGTNYEVLAYVKATGTSVVIGVKAGVVTDKEGGTNAGISSTKTNDKLAAGAREVMIDDVLPMAKIAVPEGNQPVSVGFTATFTFTDQVGSGDDATNPTLNRDVLGDDGLEMAEVTATGAAITNLIAKPGNFKAYIATVTPNADAEKVVITVAADAVTDAAGNGNEAASSREILTGYTAQVVQTGTGIGTKLSSPRVGFSVSLGPVNADSFVVLAKSPSDTGFTSGAGDFSLNNSGMPMDPTRIDIDDAAWVDLKHFLVTREGGTIDLVKQGNGAAVKSLVISEVMWGNDAGLGVGSESDSQWIELYNTTGTTITAGTWELVFTAKSRGDAMLSGDTAKATTTATLGALTTAAAPVVDKLSTWRDVGSYWDWRISDSAGGSHGQSGKSTPNSATSVGNQQELVSMQRKIDYDKVKKQHDANDVVKNRTEQLKGVPGGVAAGNWEASPEHGEMLTWRKGTPGAAPTIKKVDQSGIARGSVVFNEIANRSDKKHDWIELYNKSGSAKKINGWELSLVTATGTDTELFTFTSDDDINVPAKGYLLIVNTDPRNTPLEGGYDVINPGNSARQSDGAGDKPSRLYYVSDKLDIPNTPFLLILRNGNDKTGTHEKVEDVAGHNPRFDDDAKSTQVWPLNSWSVGALDDLGQKNDKTWVRDQGKAVFHGDAWKPDGGFTGVGIDRNAGTGDNTSGTPGYANNAVQTEVKSDGLKNANAVIISEIMFTTDGRLPQWIELHNPSHDQAVNLKGWKLEIFNYYGDETLEVNHYAELKSLPERRIQPNQTILIVSRATSRTSDSKAFPDNRIIDVWAETELRNALDMQNQRDAILSARGFHLKLSDPRKTVVDEVGNIDTNRRTNDEPDWELPGGALENGRSSMVRDIEGSAGDGTERDAWRDATMVDSSKIQPDATELYYGDDDDIGTPGYTPGGVLPVQLSSFYSKRNDSGAVVITWSTESELDNAGFNILRSQSRTGEFVRINAQLIPGAGTTGEKSAYTWTDTSAKPNVLYFYQIEDVSLAGDHRTLRTTRLRGYIGAAGKATTTWGDLKSRE